MCTEKEHASRGMKKEKGKERKNTEKGG